MAADLQVSGYSWLPDPVPNGAATEFSIRVTNNGPGSVSDAVVAISVSNRFRVDAGDFPSYCTLSGAVGSQMLSCALPTVETGDRTFTYTATAVAIGSANTTATISSATAGDLNPANNSLTVTPAVQAGADLTVVKDDGLADNMIAAGGVISYTLTASNAGPDSTAAIRLTDNLPPASDFEYQSAAGTNWSCAPSGTQVICNYSGVAIMGPLPVVTVTGKVVRQTTGTITNNAFASLASPLVLDPKAGNNAAPPVVTTIVAGSDMRVSKAMPAIMVQGTAANVTLGLFNEGPQTITGATVTDTFASNFTIGTLPAGCSAVGQTVTCAGGTLANGQNRTFVIPVTATTVTAGNQVNSASLTMPAGFVDAVTSNNSAQATYRIVAPTADLSVTKSKTPNPVAAGGEMTSTITVRNNGPSALSYSPAAPLRVTDAVSADESYSSADAAWGCSQTGNNITCNTTGTGTLAVNGTIVLTLKTIASATANAALNNTACTGSTGNSQATPLDTNIANDCTGAGVRATTANADMTVTKEVSLSAAGPWVQSGLVIPSSAADFFIRFTANNLGGDNVTTVVVTDTLPNSLNTGGFVTGVVQDSASAGSVGYTASSGRISWTFSNLASGSSQTAIVKVSRPFSSGAYDNIANITSPDTVDGNNLNNSSTASYTAAPLADIAVTGKSISPDPARVGVVAKYTISIRNNGANPAENVVLTDTIDPTRFQLVGNPATTKGGSSCSKDDATGAISCNLNIFNRGEAFQVTQDVRPLFPFGGATSFPVSHTNTAAATTTTDESNTTNNSASVTHSVTAPGFDLAISKQEPGPEYDPLRFGDELVYDLRVSNFGPSRATNLVITDVPAPPAGYTMTLAGFAVNPVAANSGLTLYTPPAPSCATVGGNVECRLHSSSPALNFLDPLNQVIFRLRFTPAGAAPSGSLTFTNGANVIALEQDNTTVNQADTQLANNSATQTTTVLPSTDLEVVSKTRVTALPAGVNQPVEYDIVIRNNGVSPTTQVRVTDQLPAGFVLANPAPVATPSGGASVSGIACTGASTVLCILNGTFPADGSPVTIKLFARAQYPYSGPLGSDVTNTATIAPGQDSGGQELSRDSVPTNNSKTANTQIADSSIAGQVFADDNLDNAVQAGEAIAGVTVVLSGTDAYGNAIAPITRTTAADGSYLFDGLPAGTYTIVETQPAGLVDARETAGSAGGAVNNASFGSDVAQNSISAIALPVATDATGYLFQEVRAGSIEGIVYRDANNNGTIDAGETGIPPADFPAMPQIRLTGTDYAGNPVYLTRTVDANGHYSFTDVPPSDAAGYTVTQLVQPTGLADGLDSNGAGNTVPNSGGRIAPEDIAVGPFTPGTALTNRNFGEIPTSTLTGTVFLDPNANAVKEAGETTGLAGAVIRLTGTNDIGQAVDCSVTTDATGNYVFPLVSDPNPACRVLRPGTYSITETPPPGLNPSGAFIGSAGGSSGGASGPNSPAPGAANTSVAGVVITAGTTATRYDFGATGQGLGGYVYLDRNGNGVRDPGEAGISGVTITLKGTAGTGQNVCAIAPSCTAITDDAGNYLFVNVPGSDATGYTLNEQAQTSPPLSAYADGTDAPGTVDGAVRGTAGNDVISDVLLGAGQLGVNYAFGERAGSLSGTTYIDSNDDGVRKPGETPLPGITVTLSGTTLTGADICTARAALDPALSCTTTTAADGSYRFDDLPAGNYTLTESQPSDYADGRESAGTSGGTIDNGSFGGTAATNRVANIALGNGVQGTGYDFGEGAITIAGRVYKDRERDGVDGGAPGIPGVTITLRQGGTVIATTTTGPDGSYRFENLPAGSYTIEESQPAGYGSSTPNSQSVNVSVGADQSIDFGETVSTIAGSVFVDGNDEGIRQAGERGLEGVTVRLTGTDAAGNAVDRTLTTDASGNYLFDDLLSGTYSVAEVQPAGFSDGKDSVGTAGGTAGNDSLSAIPLAEGIDATGYVFGERGQGQGGIVYVDSNLNGVQDPGEPGIAGVTIELQKPDGSVVGTVTTGPDGSYSFADIEAGDYVIVEQQPAGYGDAAEHPANRVPLTVSAGTPVAPINFGERLGSIAGGVYNDTNGNGRRDADEPAIPGVTVTLSGTDARGNAVTQTTVSGADGSYRFTDLPGGSYRIVETQPEGYGDGTDTPGSIGGTASGDTISDIPLGAAQDATGYLFGEQGEGARLAGRVWLDNDHDRVFDSNEPIRADWTVELLLNGVLISTTKTGADGTYAFTGIAPGAGYEVRFRNPESNALYGGARTNETGTPVTDGVMSPANPTGATVETGLLTNMTLVPGANILQQSLPLDPSGVVYDAVRRVAVEEATVRITGPAGFDPAVHLLGGAANVAQVTGSDGAYQYLLLPGAPAGTYTLSVTPPGGSYNPIQPSSIIPPCAGPLVVGPTPDPMLIALSNGAPPTSALAACTTGGDTTAYFLSFTLTPGVSANVINNNIPIDPILEGAIEVTKTTPMKDVNRGGLVPYTITARNTLAGAITGITVTDRVPAGFRYRQGSATIGGLPVDPVENGRMLSWANQNFTAGETKTYQLILVVGSGVGEGEHVNQAFAVNAAVNSVVSNLADATVRLTPDPDFDCTDILGKVFDDRNMNGTQDEGEPGLPGVRLATARGLLITTDAEGRYHITCPMIANEDRGSNFIVKLDTRTLPTGFRMTTVNPETVRLTRGKFAKLNFGAALGRVVRLDVNGDAFAGEQVGTAFLTQIDALVATLAERPSVLRLAYGARGEDASLIRRRLDALREAVEERWQQRKDRYRLVIEKEAAIPVALPKGDVK